MADIFSVPTFDPQDRINEAVDESKGHIHRLFMIGIFLGFSVAAWGLGRAFQSTYIVSAILLRQRRISWETIAAVRSITMVAAYLSFCIALALCIVSAYSLPARRARYGGIQTDDVDFVEAKRSWKTAVSLLALAATISLIILLLFWFFPVIIFA